MYTFLVLALVMCYSTIFWLLMTSRYGRRRKPEKDHNQEEVP